MYLLLQDSLTLKSYILVSHIHPGMYDRSTRDETLTIICR